MASLVMGSKTFTQFPAGATRTAGSYWMHAPHPRGEAREMEDITAEATDGVEKVDHGFRGRVIGPIVVMIVASSDANLVAAYKTILSAVENKPDGITIVMPYGETYINCYVMSGFPDPKDKQPDETGTVYQIVELMFTQDRES